MKETLQFVADACSRIRLAQDTPDYDEVLSDELEQIEDIALGTLSTPKEKE